MVSSRRKSNLRKVALEDLITLRGNRCQGCYWHFDEAQLEVDHIGAKSDGGPDIFENLTLLCARCNKIKSNKLALEGLRDRLKDDPVAMPQPKDGGTTEYVVNGQRFVASVKPTKALRDLLDEVSQYSQSFGRSAGFSEAVEMGTLALRDLQPLGDIPVAKDAPAVRQSNWISLDDEGFDPTGLKPGLLRLYDGTVEDIDSWREVIRKNAVKLVEEGKLVASDCPIATGERAGTSVVNSEPRHHGGAKSATSDWTDIGGGIWCWYTRTATGILERTRTLLRTCGVDVGAVQFQLSQD